MRAPALLLLLVAARAHADGLDLPAGAASVARAGAATLATDDATALLYDPAGLARRASLRLQLGFALHERTADYTPSAPFSTIIPVQDRAGSSFLPWGGVEYGITPDLVIGAAILAPGELSLGFPTAPLNLTADDRSAFPQRYAGERLAFRRWGGGLGAAVHPLPWLALGVSALAYDVSLDHARAIWAGTGDATTIADLVPAADMDFAISAADHFVPAATAGIVIAPIDLPIEIGASFAWNGTAHLAGTPTLTAARGGSIPASVVSSSTTLDLPLPMTARAAVRWLGDRATVELDGELDLASGTPAWSVAGVSFGDGTPISRVALGPVLRDHFAIHAGVDYAVVPGTLTLLGGYAFTSAGATAGSASPIFPDLDAHTIAVGVEGRVPGATVTLGVAYTFSATATITGSDDPVTAPGAGFSVPSAPGRLGTAGTLVALDVEIELL